MGCMGGIEQHGVLGLRCDEWDSAERSYLQKESNWALFFKAYWRRTAPITNMDKKTPPGMLEVSRRQLAN